MIPLAAGAALHEPDLRRVLDSLQDALMELEVWRQRARSPEEWSALRRLAAALAAAQQEVAEGVPPLSGSRDAAQGSLLP